MYPRVTEILKPFTSYDKVPREVLDKAAARGTSVHAICAGIAKGAWIPDGMIETELKTSAKPQKTYPVQMAAYKRLLETHDIKIQTAILVYLNKDGEFPIIDTIEDMTEQTGVFIAALKCWNFFNKGTKRGRKSEI